MFAFFLGNDFWMTSTPVIAVGLLAALVVLAWDWRFALPGLFLVQTGIGQLAVERGMMPSEWGRVFFWVMLAALLILVLSIVQSERPPPVGRLGTAFLRLLLLSLAALFLRSAEIGHLLPQIDRGMSQLLLWIAACALFAIANAEGSLETGGALLLWLIGAEIALLAVAPAAVVVVILGILFLLVALACGFLLLAEDPTLALTDHPLTDAVFPAYPQTKKRGIEEMAATLVRRLANIGSQAQGDNRS